MTSTPVGAGLRHLDTGRSVHGWQLLMLGTVAVAALGLSILSVLGYLHNRPLDPIYPVYRFGSSAPDIVRDIGVAWTFLLAGLIAWWRWPQNRAGMVMVAVGVSLLFTGIQYLPIPPLVTIGMWLGSGHVSFLLVGVLLLGFPGGRIRRPWDRAWVLLAGGYLLIQLAVAMSRPRPPLANCRDCHPVVTVFQTEPMREAITVLTQIGFTGLSLLLLALLIWRWWEATRATRHALRPVWLLGGLMAVLAPSLQLFWYTSGRGRAPTLLANLPWIEAVVLLLIPVALLGAVLRAQLGRAAVGELAVQLGGPVQPSLREALRRATGDPLLEVALWSDRTGRYQTVDGEPINLSDAARDRSVTLLEGQNGRLAALIHDPALGEQQSLIEGVAAVAHLSLENERLHAEVKAQLDEVRASRERIVRAADYERRRVERNIHDGAQQRLVSLSLALNLVQARAVGASPEVAAALADARAELKRAIDDLRELARGIHPAILTEAGLAEALESLGTHSPVPVRVELDLDARPPALVEATAYFVAAEALTNVAKYAAASTVVLRAAASDGWLRLTITDDGVGGADPDRGTGLHGLQDRVAAVGGNLSVSDAAGGGTTVAAEIPYR
jgi:signal transduction histidine kinase